MRVYTYKVTKVQCIVKDDLKDYIKFVDYNMVAEENGVSTSVPIYACLPNVETDPNFIPYSDTTEAQVIQWSNSAVGEEYLLQMKAVLDKQLDDVFAIQLPYYKPLNW
jgi:hypothetical protein